MWRVGLLLFLVAGSRQLSITEFSVPSPINSGEDVHLKCKYGLDDNESDRALFVKWWWTPHNASSDERSQLYQRIVGHAPDVLHSNIHVEEGDNIKLVNASPRDSGTYECEVSNIDEIRKHDDLTVFTGGDGPELNITKVEDGDDEDTDEDISITCSANNVAPEPELVITVNGETVEITTKQIVWTPDEGLYDVFANATLSEKDMDGAAVSCELVFLDANITHPQYIYTETYYSDINALSTTETPEDPTTPEATSMSLENGSGAGDMPTSYLLLVFSAFSITMIVHNLVSIVM